MITFNTKSQSQGGIFSSIDSSLSVNNSINNNIFARGLQNLSFRKNEISNDNNINNNNDFLWDFYQKFFWYSNGSN